MYKCCLYVALLILNLITVRFASAQALDSLFDPISLKISNTAFEANYLSPSEKEIILLINLARYDGLLFTEKIVVPYANHNEEGFSINSKEIKSLMNDLKTIKNKPPLLPDNGLFDMAKSHATKMGQSGKIGHENYEKRFKKYNQATGENCSYGFNEPLLIIMQLLIDKDVPSKGHRKNILGLDGISEKFTHLGVAIKPHKIWSFNCVMDFAKLTH